MSDKTANDAAVVWMLKKAAKDGYPFTLTIDGKLYQITVKPAPAEL